MFDVRGCGLRLSASALLVFATGGCALGLTAPVGPSTSAVMRARGDETLHNITVIELGKSSAPRLHFDRGRASFADTLGDGIPVGTVVNRGDVLDISIWEAPPAALFGTTPTMSSKVEIALASASSGQVSTSSTFAGLLVGDNGTVFVPFAGNILVAGRSTRQIENDITARLSGKAHQPQVIVRIAHNASSDVTIIGDVTRNLRMPLSPKGERLLDALALAGGTTKPASKITIQVTRQDRVIAMPLDTIIRDPKQNVILEPGDVVTAIFQPYSFTVLGAANRNEEIQFESTGLTLAQAFGRIGGLAPYRAKADGLFLFRWEQPGTIDVSDQAARDKDGRIPVIYRVNMKDPATYFLAQSFAMQNGDVIYVATAASADFQQFVNIIAQTVLPVIAVKNAL
ncbi:MAG: polysaccharide biosynthesis/export family protein [Sphingomonas sp.]|nr:polysaccharide biosynthesis/export family protein [Sphingomonas sp.]